MSAPDRFSNDFALAQRCLEGDPQALARLQLAHGPLMTSFLLRAGAQRSEAEEVVGTLWTDLVVAHGTRLARFTFYSGNCALSTWLNTVALNELISRKRLRSWEPLLSEPDANASTPGEAPVIEVMQQAIEAAFTRCDPEEFVLLQLAHCDRLRGHEIAILFGCTPSTVSRRLAAAERNLERATLDFVRERDPWLELRWDDFVELCRAATPACFGLET